MIRVTHAGDGFSDGIKEVIIDGNKISSVDDNGKVSKCTWDAEWLVSQAAKKDSDLRFKSVPK